MKKRKILLRIDDHDGCIDPYIEAVARRDGVPPQHIIGLHPKPLNIYGGEWVKIRKRMKEAITIGFDDYFRENPGVGIVCTHLEGWPDFMEFLYYCDLKSEAFGVPVSRDYLNIGGKGIVIGVVLDATDVGDEHAEYISQSTLDVGVLGLVEQWCTLNERFKNE